MLFLAFYLGLCALVGWCGANRRFGFWGYFFFSLIFTPLLGLLFVIGSGKPMPMPSSRINRIVGEIEELKSYVARFQSVGLTAAETKDLVDRIATLKRSVLYDTI
jgi:hypothetical protein